MSTKATASSRKAARAITGHKRDERVARAAADAAKLAKDAEKAAIAAACAAERVRISNGNTTNSSVTDIFEIQDRVRSATKQAIKYATNAIQSESVGGDVNVICFANQAATYARKAAALATVAAVIAGMKKEMISNNEPTVPEISENDRHAARTPTKQHDTLAAAINHSSRYLVTYDGKIIATFEREEDAFLFESELADLDQAHEVSTANCEVVERRTGKRLGGYLLSAGKLIVFLRDSDRKRGGRKGRAHS